MSRFFDLIHLAIYIYFNIKDEVCLAPGSLLLISGVLGSSNFILLSFIAHCIKGSLSHPSPIDGTRSHIHSAFIVCPKFTNHSMSQSPPALSLDYTSYESIDDPELEAQNHEDGSERKIRSTIQVLKEFLQSNDTIAELKACKALYDMMPEAGTHESWYEGMLASLILSTADQISHDNTAQDKLVRLVGELARCDRFNVLRNRRWYTNPEGVGQLSLVYSNYVYLRVYARTWCEIFNGKSQADCYTAYEDTDMK